MSNVSFAMLSGAGVIDCSDEGNEKVYMHSTYDLPVRKADNGDFYAELDPVTRNGDVVFVSKEAPVYGVVLNSVGGIKSYLSAISLAEISTGTSYNPDAEPSQMGKIDAGEKNIYFKLASSSNYVGETDDPKLVAGDIVRIDCYTVHGKGATQINIDANSFAGYYYIEARTLFRDEATGKDFPAEFVIPRGKIQSNFTFTMASTGDPSTFDFVIDCFPAYTAFSKSKKVLAQLNVIDPDAETHNYGDQNIHGHKGRKGDSDVDTIWGGSIFEN